MTQIFSNKIYSSTGNYCPQDPPWYTKIQIGRTGVLWHIFFWKNIANDIYKYIYLLKSHKYYGSYAKTNSRPIKSSTDRYAALHLRFFLNILVQLFVVPASDPPLRSGATAGLRFGYMHIKSLFVDLFIHTFCKIICENIVTWIFFILFFELLFWKSFECISEIQNLKYFGPCVKSILMNFKT